MKYQKRTIIIFVVVIDTIALSKRSKPLLAFYPSAYILILFVLFYFNISLVVLYVDTIKHSFIQHLSIEQLFCDGQLS